MDDTFVATDAAYGHIVTTSPGVGAQSITVSQDSADAFPLIGTTQKNLGKQFSLTINPDTGGLPDNATTERVTCTLSSVSGSGIGATWTFTVSPLAFGHSIGDQVMELVSAEALQGTPKVASSSAMQTWLSALGNVVTGGGPAILVRLCDSFGSDFVNCWSAFDSYMCKKYNGSQPAIASAPDTGTSPGGLTSIAGGIFPWPTIQGSTLDGTPSNARGISGYAQQMTPGQNCISGRMLFDVVRFHWLAGGASTTIQLLVDGTVVNTVSGASAGHYDYVLPNGPGIHTIAYKNNSGSGNVIVDDAYLFYNNYSSGIQIWDISHIGWTTGNYVGMCSQDLLTYITALQPHAVVFCTQTNDTNSFTGSPNYGTSMRSLVASVLGAVTTPPSLAFFSSYQARSHGGSLGWGAWQEQARQIAIANNGILIDLLPIIGAIGGSGGAADAAGYTIDGVHPSQKTIQQYFGPLMQRVFDLVSLPAPFNSGELYSAVANWFTVTASRNMTGQELGGGVVFNAASGVNFVVPAPQDLAVPVGGVVDVVQEGAGTVTVAAATVPGGTTAASIVGNTTTAGQNTKRTLRAISATTWLFQ